jgi:hypothetical protein
VNDLTEYVPVTDRPLILTFVGDILWRRGILRESEIPHPHAGSPSRRFVFWDLVKARRDGFPIGRLLLARAYTVGCRPIKPRVVEYTVNSIHLIWSSPPDILLAVGLNKALPVSSWMPALAHGLVT